jgi:hypothetical protein
MKAILTQKAFDTTIKDFKNNSIPHTVEGKTTIVFEDSIKTRLTLRLCRERFGNSAINVIP